MIFRTLFLILLFLLNLLAACGGSAQGGSEFGNPARTLQGTVVSGEEATLRKTTLSNTLLRQQIGNNECPADQVIATDSQAQTTLAEINQEDCSFEMELTINKSYVVSFTRDDEFIATLIVRRNASSLGSSVFFMAEANTEMNLGAIRIEGSKAIPENEPATQNDQDEDGVDDFSDEDDDGDGVSDNDEEDCDLDGFIDDDDENNGGCDSDEEGEDDEESGEEDEGDPVEAQVFEVSPANDEVFVDLDEEVWVRFGCEVSEDSVNADTFYIESETDFIECEFDFQESGEVVTCDHEDQEFLPETTYTVTVEGVFCEDETEIEPETWSFTTHEEDE